MTRPKLKPSIEADEFDSFYWYKDELIDFAKSLNISSVGGKFDIHDRISAYLRGGPIPANKNDKPKSNFDWTYATLNRNTQITDNYRNTKNVRQFLQEQIGEKVSFSITVMNWMQKNVGKNLGDFIDQYSDIQNERLNQKIPEHNQFNRYVRDFMKNNPALTKQDAVACWKKVIAKPRPGSKGRGIFYSKSDLLL